MKKTKISGFFQMVMSFLKKMSKEPRFCDEWRWMYDQLMTIKNISNEERKELVDYLIYHHFSWYECESGQKVATKILLNLQGRYLLEKAMSKSNFSQKEKYYLENIYILMLVELYKGHKSDKIKNILAKRILQIIIDLEIYHHIIDCDPAIDYDEVVEIITKIQAIDIVEALVNNKYLTVWEDMRVKRFLKDCCKAAKHPDKKLTFDVW